MHSFGFEVTSAHGTYGQTKAEEKYRNKTSHRGYFKKSNVESRRDGIEGHLSTKAH